MAKYGLVAGEHGTRVIKGMIDNFEDMEVTYTPKTMDVMIDELTKTGGLHIQDLKSVIIIDFAFEFNTEGDVNKIAEEFVALQDLMRSNRLEHVTLYLVTKNTDLFEKLKGNVAGVPGIYFESVQVLLIRDDYKAALLRSVLLGEQDNSGLYNKSVSRNKSRKERLKEERDIELESRRNLSEEIKRFDTSEPVSVISELDYVDSDIRIAKERQREREERDARRKAERRSKREDKEEEEEVEDVSVNIYGGSKAVNTGSKEEVTGGTGVGSNLFELFDNIKNVRTDVAKGKIETDNGVVSIVGDYAAGGSGVVANMAEMYAMAKRKVLIIDLDIQHRMQTIYFNQYDKVVANQRGASNSLIEVIQGYNIRESVVPVTKWLHILSVSREDEVSLNWVDAVAGGLEAVLIEAREMYDVIILDIPFRFFTDYMEIIENVDRNVFIVENKFYKVENFIENVLHPILLDRTEEMENIIKNSNIIINKFKRGTRDLEGNEINRKYLRKLLDGVGYPYDNIGVAGEIPEYSAWEDQFFTGVRYVWQDTVSLGVYRRVFGKVIM